MEYKSLERRIDGYRRAAGVPTKTFINSPGINDPHFIIWSRFGALQKAYGTYELDGAAKRALAKRIEKERYKMTCFDSSAAALAQALNAPPKMKSEVHRIVFGHDVDGGSEDAENPLLARLPKRPASAMPVLQRAPLPEAYAQTGKLEVGKPLGVTRPSAVRPRPSSGGRMTQIMHVQRGTPEFQAEMEKARRKYIMAWANQRGNPPPVHEIPGVPNPRAFHTGRR